MSAGAVVNLKGFVLTRDAGAMERDALQAADGALAQHVRELWALAQHAGEFGALPHYARQLSDDLEKRKLQLAALEPGSADRLNAAGELFKWSMRLMGVSAETLQSFTNQEVTTMNKPTNTPAAAAVEDESVTIARELPYGTTGRTKDGRLVCSSRASIDPRPYGGSLGGKSSVPQTTGGT